MWVWTLVSFAFFSPTTVNIKIWLIKKDHRCSRGSHLPPDFVYSFLILEHSLSPHRCFDLRRLQINFWISLSRTFIRSLHNCTLSGPIIFFPGIKSLISVAFQNRMCEQQVQQLEIESWGVSGSGWCHGAREAKRAGLATDAEKYGDRTKATEGWEKLWKETAAYMFKLLRDSFNFLSY